MRVSIVSTGEEILRGEVLDTNAAFASELLDDHGFELVRRYTCGDDLDALIATIQQALVGTDALIACGGLGPTQDDRTLEAVALVLNRRLVEDEGILERLRARFAAAGVEFTPNQARQARRPEGATALENPQGTAPGIAARHGDKWLFCLPGPPREFQPMLQQTVLPSLQAERDRRGETGVCAARVLKVFGRGEGWVADALSDLGERIEHVQLGFRAATPEIHLKLRTHSETRAEAEQRLDRAERLVRERLGAHVFGTGATSLPAATLELLSARGLTLAVAESCTGGLIGKLLTDVPGSSQVFVLSAVTYANAAKQAVLGVGAELLAAHGAVSDPCARAMAEGVRRLAGSDLSVAVTGIAGPEGGSPDKPVGTVYFATCGPEGTEVTRRLFPAPERAFVRRLAAHAALELIRRRVLAQRPAS